MTSSPRKRFDSGSFRVNSGKDIPRHPWSKETARVGIQFMQRHVPAEASPEYKTDRHQWLFESAWHPARICLLTLLQGPTPGIPTSVVSRRPCGQNVVAREPEMWHHLVSHRGKVKMVVKHSKDKDGFDGRLVKASWPPILRHETSRCFTRRESLSRLGERG